MRTQTKSLITLFFLLHISFACFSQIEFSNGYILKNNGDKIECLIRNNDWLYNPSEIKYKLNKQSEVITAGIDSIKEFGIDNYSKYSRATIKIDRSGTTIEKYSRQKAPEWSVETLFLKELVTGKAKLWQYVDNSRTWFFYSIDNSTPEQLIFKEYLSDNNQAYKNISYQQQLSAYIQNNYTQKINVEEIKYDDKDLKKYFKQFNNTTESNIAQENKLPKREIFNTKIVGSINYSALSVFNNTIDDKPIEYGGKIRWMAGLELEYFLSFNRNTWSLICNPTYEQFYESAHNRTFDVKAITFPAGGRYSKYLKSNQRIYFDISYNPNITILLKDYFAYTSYAIRLQVSESNNFILGAGYSYKNFGIQLKYHTNRDLLSDRYAMWSTNETKISLSASYKLFKIEN